LTSQHTALEWSLLRNEIVIHTNVEEEWVCYTHQWWRGMSLLYTPMVKRNEFVIHTNGEEEWGCYIHQWWRGMSLLYTPMVKRNADIIVIFSGILISSNNWSDSCNNIRLHIICMPTGLYWNCYMFVRII
jgi:hypothetical protein